MVGYDVAIIGAGISGIAAAYYLSRDPAVGRIVLIDRGQPMEFTSAQSGENYRNWWPHPLMTAFTDHSIDLMEDLALETGNAFSMTRRGYALATRSEGLDGLLDALKEGYGQDTGAIRIHGPGSAGRYRPPVSANWETAPDGVDVLSDPDVIKRCFPSFDPEIRHVLHIRRAGDVDSQQLGKVMLDAARAKGLVREIAVVEDITGGAPFRLSLRGADGPQQIEAEMVVNAAGPFACKIGQMLGYDLPVVNVRQQKIAFEDTASAIPRDMPFSIDLDSQFIDWTDEERALLAEDPEQAWLTQPMPGAIHCKAEGGENGTWVKLGWAYTTEPTEASWTPELDDRFPEIVLRGAARLNPGLKTYYGKLPRQMSHYGGYYTMTEENWPLIGPAGPEGSHVISALSGFGTMAACAAGDILARRALGRDVPDYATKLGLERLGDEAMLSRLREIAHKSVL